MNQRGSTLVWMVVALSLAAVIALFVLLTVGLGWFLVVLGLGVVVGLVGAFAAWGGRH